MLNLESYAFRTKMSGKEMWLDKIFCERNQPVLRSKICATYSKPILDILDKNKINTYGYWWKFRRLLPILSVNDIQR